MNSPLFSSHFLLETSEVTSPTSETPEPVATERDVETPAAETGGSNGCKTKKDKLIQNLHIMRPLSFSPHLCGTAVGWKLISATCIHAQADLQTQFKQHDCNNGNPSSFLLHCVFSSFFLCVEVKPEAAVDDWEAIASDEEKGELWRKTHFAHSAARSCFCF